MSPLTTLHGSAEVTLSDGTLPLPDGFVVPFAAGAVVTAWLDGCVALWPRAAWDRLAARLVALPIGEPRARAFARLVFASAVATDEMPLSVPVSDGHRQAADVDGAAVLVGAGDHAELWSRDRWAAHARQELDRLGEVLAS